MPLDLAQDTRRAVVIGAGLSGLAAARKIAIANRDASRPIELVVLEAKHRVGGAIWTDRRDGFTLEAGADSFITNKPEAVDLCRSLGLEDQLIEPDRGHRRSFVVQGGKLSPVPEGFVLMAPGRLIPILTTPILSWRGKLRLFLDLLIPRKTDDDDESLASFVRRRLGKEALDRLVQPLVAGIYTADPAELSLKATLPRFVEMEKRHGGLIRGALAEIRQGQARRADSFENASGARYGLFLSLLDGMDGLPNALAESLPAGSLRLGALARRIERDESAGLWRVELLDGPPIAADAVLLAAEAHASARLVDPLDGELAQSLRSIPHASSIVARVAYERDQIAHPLDGFGAVVPAIENRSILAVSFLSVKFPRRAPKGTVLLRVFLGGATRPDLFDLDDSAVRSLVVEELSSLLSIRGEPLLFDLARHSRAMPQYTLGHLDRVLEIRRLVARHPRLFLCGNAFDGVGIPDCIRGAHAAADLLLSSLADPAALGAA